MLNKSLFVLMFALLCLVMPAFSGVIFENFDSLIAPALPAGWTATNAAGATPLWVSQSGAACYGGSGGCLFVNDPSTVSDKRVETPSMVAGGSLITFTFQNDDDLESQNPTTGYDGGVFEVSVNGGVYQDASSMPGFAATSNWYNNTISTSFSSPIAGQQAWSGNSGGYILTSGSFSANPADTLQFRFRMASDNSIADVGWRIDDLQINGGDAVPEPATLTLVFAGLAGLLLVARRSRA